MANRRRVLSAVAAGLAAFALAPLQQAVAQKDWPSRPVRIIVPYDAGGAADRLGRIAAKHLEETLGQPFVVENRGGAGGMVGSQYVMRKAPDGYTLLVSGLGSSVIAPMITPGKYDAVKDFTNIAMLGGSPSVLVVHPSVPAQDLKGFISYVNDQPKGLSWGSSGHGTHGHLLGEVFKDLNKLDMVHIAYKGLPIADLLGGQITAAYSTVSSFGPHIAAGKLRGIAVTSEKRLPGYPNVPTFSELGYPQLTSIGWFGLSGPAGVPQPVVDKLNAEVVKLFNSKEMQAQFEKEGLVTSDMDAAAFAKHVQTEIDFWQPYVKASQQK